MTKTKTVRTTAKTKAKASVKAVVSAATVVAAATETEKCTKRLARIAGKSAKCLLSLLREDLYTAGIASKSTGSLAEGTKFPQKRAEKALSYFFLDFYFLPLAI